MSPLRSGPFWPGDSPANQVCRGPGDGGLDQGRRRQAVGGVRRGLRARDRRAICHVLGPCSLRSVNGPLSESWGESVSEVTRRPRVRVLGSDLILDKIDRTRVASRATPGVMCRGTGLGGMCQGEYTGDPRARVLGSILLGIRSAAPEWRHVPPPASCAGALGLATCAKELAVTLGGGDAQRQGLVLLSEKLGPPYRQFDPRPA